MKSAPRHTNRWCNPITILALLLKKEKPKEEHLKDIDFQVETVSLRQTCGFTTSYSVETADPPQPGGSVASCLDQQAVSPALAFPDRRSEVSPWEISFDRNLQHSKILRLPEELLLEIMRTVATDDLYMLRQVSFTFWRIYQSKIFSEFHRRCKSIWVFNLHQTGGFENDEKTVLRAKKHAFCGGCYGKRTSPNYLRERGAYELGRGFPCSYCGSSHITLCFPPQDRVPCPPGRPRQCTMPNAFVSLCSHLKVPGSRIWQEAMKKLARGVWDPKTPVQSCHQCMGLAERAALEKGQDYIKPPAWYFDHYVGELKISWQLPIFEIPQHDTITISFLLQQLEEFKETYGNVLCSHIWHDHTQLLRALDPRYCSCMGGDSRVGRVLPYDKEHWGTPDCMGRGKIGLPQKHIVSCGDCRTRYTWERFNNQVFLSRHSVLYIWENLTEKISWRAEFAAIFDPVSHNPMSDHETKHLFWCENRGCRNGKDWIEYSNAFKEQ